MKRYFLEGWRVCEKLSFEDVEAGFRLTLGILHGLFDVSIVIN